MQFSNISYIELAKMFVYSKKEKIEQLLDVKNLDTITTIEILCEFIRKQGDDFWKNYQNKYAPLFDDVFFYSAVDELKKAQHNGAQFDGGPRFSEPNISYVL